MVGEGRRIVVDRGDSGGPCKGVHSRQDGVTPRRLRRLALSGLQLPRLSGGYALDAVMKADAVAHERREAWVADRVKQGIDVMICHPRLVQTGLDLIDFPTLVWFETEFSVFQSTQESAVLMGSRFGCKRG